MFANDTQIIMQMANIESYPSLKKTFTDEIEYNVPDGTY